MKLEITYANPDATKVTVDIPDAEIVALADQKAKLSAVKAVQVAEAARGKAVSVKVV